MITVEQAAQEYFDIYFERFDGMGVAKYNADATIPNEIDQSEWEKFWLALDEIEHQAQLKDIEQTGKAL